MKKSRVYDDRTDETLFESDEPAECFVFIMENYDEDDDDFPHVWIESFEMK